MVAHQVQFHGIGDDVGIFFRTFPLQARLVQRQTVEVGFGFAVDIHVTYIQPLQFRLGCIGQDTGPVHGQAVGNPPYIKRGILVGHAEASAVASGFHIIFPCEPEVFQFFIGNEGIRVEGADIQDGLERSGVGSQVDAYALELVALGIVVGYQAVGRVLPGFAAPQAEHVFVATVLVRDPIVVERNHEAVVPGRESVDEFLGIDVVHPHGGDAAAVVHPESVLGILAGNVLKTGHPAQAIGQQFLNHVSILVHQIEIKDVAVAAHHIAAHAVQHFELVIPVESVAGEPVFVKVELRTHAPFVLVLADQGQGDAFGQAEVRVVNVNHVAVVLFHHRVHLVPVGHERLLVVADDIEEVPFYFHRFNGGAFGIGGQVVG